MAKAQNGEILFAPGEVDPTDPELVKELKAQRITRQFEEEDLDLARLQDLQEGRGVTVNGLTARPLSASVIAILQDVGNPVFPKDGSVAAAMEVSMYHMLEIVYCLFCPDAEAVLDTALAGPQALRKAALRFGLQLTPEWQERAIAEVQALIAGASDDMDDYLAGGDDDGKKKSATG